jgi:hypothetical protein
MKRLMLAARLQTLAWAKRNAMERIWLRERRRPRGLLKIFRWR